MTRPVVAVDGWMADKFRDLGALSLEEVAKQGRLGNLACKTAQRFPSLRFLVWLAAAQHADRFLGIMASRGLMPFLLIQRILGWGDRQLFLAEFFRAEPDHLVPRIKHAFHTAVGRWVFPRTLSKAIVATEWEIQTYSRRYGVASDVFVYMLFTMLRNPKDGLPAPTFPTSRTILSSGYAACDWDTVFQAAKDSDWHLTAICSPADFSDVKKLNSSLGIGAEVYDRVSPEKHDKALREAAVYILSLKEQEVASGHVRLGRAIEAGVPVVATGVRGLMGYLQDGVNSLVVPPRDPDALRQAVEKLLANPELWQTLRTTAYEWATPYTQAARLRAVASIVFPESGRDSASG